jgi:uncharacterized protein (TIGR02145 family)
MKIIYVLLPMFLFTSCEDEGITPTPPPPPPNIVDSVTDIDGNTYNTVLIGGQEWTVENLKTTKYANGDPIPHIPEGGDWYAAGDNSEDGWAYYNNDSLFNNPYGKLYNWYAVSDSRNVCPTGWHVPTYADWETLTNTLGGIDLAGGKMKSTGTDYWQSPNVEATNESGFSGLPGGYRNNGFGIVDSYMELYGFWWSSTQYNSSTAYAAGLSYINGIGPINNETYYFKLHGLSVRCVKD